MMEYLLIMIIATGSGPLEYDLAIVKRFQTMKQCEQFAKTYKMPQEGLVKMCAKVDTN